MTKINLPEKQATSNKETLTRLHVLSVQYLHGR